MDKKTPKDRRQPLPTQHFALVARDRIRWRFHQVMSLFFEIPFSIFLFNTISASWSWFAAGWSTGCNLHAVLLWLWEMRTTKHTFCACISVEQDALKEALCVHFHSCAIRLLQIHLYSLALPSSFLAWVLADCYESRSDGDTDAYFTHFSIRFLASSIFWPWKMDNTRQRNENISFFVGSRFYEPKLEKHL